MMKTLQRAALAIIPVALGVGCASSPQERFQAIVPGMDSDQVAKKMKSGPTRFEPVANTEYSAWYWGDDYCVLLKDNKVVSKDSTQIGQDFKVGSAGYQEERAAQCLAPGQKGETKTSRIVNVPGLGKVQIPERFLKDFCGKDERAGEAKASPRDMPSVPSDDIEEAPEGHRTDR